MYNIKCADLESCFCSLGVHVLSLKYTRCLIQCKINCSGLFMSVYLFVYLGFYVAFNTVQVISRRVVGRAEETST